jgi:hypothetical protein
LALSPFGSAAILGELVAFLQFCHFLFEIHGQRL